MTTFNYLCHFISFNISTSFTPFNTTLFLRSVVTSLDGVPSTSSVLTPFIVLYLVFIVVISFCGDVSILSYPFSFSTSPLYSVPAKAVTSVVVSSISPITSTSFVGSFCVPTSSSIPF